MAKDNSWYDTLRNNVNRCLSICIYATVTAQLISKFKEMLTDAKFELNIVVYIYTFSTSQMI